jgi:hypothetical protein
MLTTMKAWMQSKIQKNWNGRVKPLILAPESIKMLAVPMPPLCRAPAPGFLACWPTWESQWLSNDWLMPFTTSNFED